MTFSDPETLPAGQASAREPANAAGGGQRGPQEKPRYTPEMLAGLLDQHMPTPEQSAIISAPAEPLLVIAGAGSGKTATMADRVVWLVANGKVSPEQILGVTFTRKAAGELATRIRAQLAKLASRELLPAVEDDLAAGMVEPKISTYHSYASGIVTDYGLRLGIERDSVLLGTAQSWQLATQVVEAYEGEFDHFTAAKSSLVKAVMQLAGECSEHLREPAYVRECLLRDVARLTELPYVAGKNKASSAGALELIDRLRTRASVAELVERYAEAKRERGVLDFGDLVSLAARIADEIPLAAELERERFRIVLLDEFQDTSHAQMVLFSRLFGQGHAVTAVGDPNQSIYGFRGASAGQLFEFPTAFPVRRNDDRYEPAPTRFLSVAWRNSVNILSMANTISVPLNRVDPGERGRRLDVPALRASPAAGSGRVLLGRYETDQNEAAAIAARVEQYRATAFSRDNRTGEAEPTSAAVLCRRRAQMEPIRAALEERNIPYEIVGLGGLLSTPEIVDLVATLRVLADPTRSDSLMRLLTGARWRIGPADLMAFADWSKYLARQRERAATGGEPLELEADEPAARTVVEHDQVDSASLIEALDWLPRADWTSRHGRRLSAEARARLDALRREIAGLRTFVGDDVTTLLGEVERSMLLDIEVAAIPGMSIHYARRHLDAFEDAAAGFLQSAQRVDLSAFLGWLEAASAEEGGLDVTQVEVRRDAVQLLTVHASKGLEWDAVFVPGLNAGAFPTARDSRWSSGNSALPWPLRGDTNSLPVWDCDQPDQKGWLDSEKDFKAEVQFHTEQEERRLAYVAYTRAKHVLMCTSAAWNGSRSSAAEPSTFLAELLPLTEAQPPAAHLDSWLPAESIEDVNPMTADLLTAGWPYDPLEGPQGPDGPLRRRPGRRRQMEQAAARVLDPADPIAPHESGRGTLTGAAARWDRETGLLLAKHNAADHHLAVELPAHISASMLVDLASDPEQVIRQLRRPVPRRPGMAARKGTAFHAWIEDYFGSAGTLEFEESRPSDSYIDEAYELADMVTAFKDSQWAGRSPEAIEVPVETRIDTVVVRGRIDAVFRDADGCWDLIDWKTGTPPSARMLRTRSVQLALYRLAWARLKDVPFGQVKAAFFYVGQSKLVRPHDLADEAALEAVIRDAY